MRVNQSYLKGLGVLFFLSLGGCSWVSNWNWPNRATHPSNSQTIPSTNGPIHESSSPASDTDAIASESIASDDPIKHGERLSTLDNELPPGRLPPEIMPATGDTQRLPEIEPGRRDPFASLPARPFLVQQPSVSAVPSPASVVSPTSTTSTGSPASSTPRPQAVAVPPALPERPAVVVPVPITQQLPTPTLVQRQPRVPVTAAPTAPIAVAPLPVPASRQPRTVAPSSTPSEAAAAPSPSPSQSFEFSGVVQVGDRVNIIVEEPSGSRYVEIGARVGDGQFLIKAVDFNQGPNPAVILERGGTESVHWVGNPIAM